ncbi:MAG: UTP--glucose-1-phosphate uridylyltransferase [Bryobacteraceae bacterium]
MSVLVDVIKSTDPKIRNSSLDGFCRAASLDTLLDECAELEAFRRRGDNLYENVRALFFLYSIHRFHVPDRVRPNGAFIPFDAFDHLINRRFEEAIRAFHEIRRATGLSPALASGFAAAYRGLAFQTLSNQVRRSVRSVRGNQWMFRAGHPADFPLRLRPELLAPCAETGLFPLLAESTPVRMDLSHSGWSDIFFLGMDFPEGARVLNISIDLAVRGSGASPQPPVEAYLRVIDEPVLRLTSVDLEATTDVATIDEVFDFARDYLGLLKAAVIASGLIPSGMEGGRHTLADVFTRLIGKPGYGLEIVSKVNGIPKGSRLAVSTNLLACLISACMRATGQAASLTGGLTEPERRIVAARAILGEWLGGSGGGWQDSGGVWPGIKLIEGVAAGEGDPEFGISRGCLLPRHRILASGEVSPEARRRLQESLVLVHGGMAQDVGPILEMVTERYLLRSEAEWTGRLEAMSLLDEVVANLKQGDIRALGRTTHRNFDGPIQTIIPWAGNYYTQALIDAAAKSFGDAFWGFWMLGGMAGGGMGFIFDPSAKLQAQERMGEMMSGLKRRLEHAVPFAMEPVVYDFAINERGTWADLRQGTEAIMPERYYALTVPALLRRETRTLPAARRAELDAFGTACRTNPALSGMVQTLFDYLVPRGQESAGGASNVYAVLDELGFDRAQHEQIRADLRAGRIGLAQNRLPAGTSIEDVAEGEVLHAAGVIPARVKSIGLDAMHDGQVAIVTLAGGVGSRWTRGAGVVKALNPFCRMAGGHRSFLEVHFAKSRQTGRLAGRAVPHVITTSYLTHQPVENFLSAENYYGYTGPVYLSPGRSVGLRLVPMVRDLRYAWEEMPQQRLDEQKEKVRDSVRAALMGWAKGRGEGSDYTENLPLQCLHPVGHWFEVPNLLLNGTLQRLLAEYPKLRYLMVHNVDTLGANIDPGILGLQIDSGAGIAFEVVDRNVDDRGGGLARIDGRPQIIEGLALPNEEIEFQLTYYNSGTSWIDIEYLLGLFDLTRATLSNAAVVAERVRTLTARIPTYVALKDVKKRWGKGQEDIYPVAQFEKLWGDVTGLPGARCQYLAVSRQRGQQLKEPAQIDGWFRDGSAAHVESLCDWT